MYTGLTLTVIFEDIFMHGCFFPACLVLLAYRVMACELPFLIKAGWKHYAMFYWAIALVGVLFYPFGDVAYSKGIVLFPLLTLPTLVVGAIGIVNGWSRRDVLVSAFLETAFFPVWFYSIFRLFIFLDVV